MAHAIHLLNQLQEFFFVLVITIQKFATRKIILFSFSNFQYIFSFNGENYATVENSKFSHRYTIGLGNYRGKAFTTGCADSSSCNVATEMLDMTILTWTDGPDYSFARRVSTTNKSMK